MGFLRKYEKQLLTPKDKINKNPSKIGKAVYDILSKSQANQTVEETIEAMRAARRGELVTVGSADNLLEMLNAGD